jgi:6-phosphogluconolactonase (cycloisomerase 2 family)
MEDNNLTSARDVLISAFSRRGFLRQSAGLAALGAVQPVAAQTGQTIAYVGAYTDRGRGIHMFYVNPANGALTPWKILTGLPSPSSLAFHPNNRYLYAINEISNYNSTPSGSVTAMSVESGTGDLRIMNVVSSMGRGPAHISVDPSGKWVFAANYGGGSIAVIPIMPDGSLGAASDVQTISGPLGPQPAVEAPPGSFAISGHDAPHAHMAETDPGGIFCLSPTWEQTDCTCTGSIRREEGSLRRIRHFCRHRWARGRVTSHFIPTGGWFISLLKKHPQLSLRITIRPPAG